MTHPVIEFSGLSHSYGSKALRRQVLFDLSGRFDPGEIVIVKGPSGSGKTTFLTLIGGLRATQEGQISVLGQRLDGTSAQQRLQIRRHIGFIFQMHNLIGALTATQNLLMALRLHPEIPAPAKAARDLLEQVGLSHALDKYPREMSGGERQRVAIARALVTRPKIVLADEPTASLDGKTGKMVVELLRDLASQNGSAVLMVTHDARILDTGDRVLEMEDGRIRAA
ncbi:ATP-binding cassette domain-containing protein [Thioclava sp. FTW29]|uniref:ATP-binding cassette domain-containing protein n=1 Tax=Thioclava litoralis TaxID=3076557 RepID=A0ABZ1E3U1_9RHOB|nr:ATP-binding cassette domain-containing protein [Thioclava sp. FTW29]